MHRCFNSGGCGCGYKSCESCYGGVAGIDKTQGSEAGQEEQPMSNGTFTKDKDNKFREVIGTKCSTMSCNEHGCQFPMCAELGQQVFDSIEHVKTQHPNAEEV